MWAKKNKLVQFLLILLVLFLCGGQAKNINSMEIPKTPIETLSKNTSAVSFTKTIFYSNSINKQLPKIISTANKNINSDSNDLNTDTNLSNQTNEARAILLKKGDSGSKVLDVQKRLDVLGYNLPLSGNYGEATYKAVYDFQEKNNLTPSGNIDAETLKKLEGIKLISPGPSKCISILADVKDKKAKEAFINKNNFASYLKYFIWVNKLSFNVTVFEGEKNKWKVLKEFPCTIGKGGVYETPAGIFQIGIKGDFFISGNVSAKYYSQIKGGVLFHTILFDKAGKKIVDSRMKMKLSHGCVRLEIPNAIYIHDNIPVGTTVFIN